MAESKNDKFQRLSTARAENAISYITSLGKLMASSYDSTLDERIVLVEVIREALDDLAETYGVLAVASDSDQPAIVETTTVSTSDGLSPVGDDPTHLEDMAMMRIGPRIGKAMEEIADGNLEEARALLRSIMVW